MSKEQVREELRHIIGEAPRCGCRQQGNLTAWLAITTLGLVAVIVTVVDQSPEQITISHSDVDQRYHVVIGAGTHAPARGL
jgi:hypothetical protein